MKAENIFDLTGKVVLVTGGNSGLGLAFARGVARCGADVLIWGRNALKNRAVLDEFVAKYPGRFAVDEVDVADERAVIAGVEKGVERFGRIDTAFVNAGISTMQPSFLDMTTPAYEELLAINQHGAFFTLRESARHMVARAEAGDPGGSLVICGSLSIGLGVPGMEHYAAAKGALNSMSKSLAVGLGRHGVRVNTIAPGFIKTDMAAANPDEGAERLFASRTPLGRVGCPDDIQGIAVYLTSDLSSFHSGDTISIDGALGVTLV